MLFYLQIPPAIFLDPEVESKACWTTAEQRFEFHAVHQVITDCKLYYHKVGPTSYFVCQQRAEAMQALHSPLKHATDVGQALIFFWATTR